MGFYVCLDLVPKLSFYLSKLKLSVHMFVHTEHSLPQMEYHCVSLCITPAVLNMKYSKKWNIGGGCITHCDILPENVLEPVPVLVSVFFGPDDQLRFRTRSFAVMVQVLLIIKKSLYSQFFSESKCFSIDTFFQQTSCHFKFRHSFSFLLCSFVFMIKGWNIYCKKTKIINTILIVFATWKIRIANCYLCCK